MPGLRIAQGLAAASGIPDDGGGLETAAEPADSQPPPTSQPAKPAASVKPSERAQAVEPAQPVAAAATTAAPQREALGDPNARRPALGASRAEEPLLRAAFQVDRFAWPGICRQLEARAAGEIALLFQAVRPAVDGPARIVGIGSAHCGEGATTVLLAAARRLSVERCPAVLVDADWPSARLSAQLGPAAGDRLGRGPVGPRACGGNAHRECGRRSGAIAFGPADAAPQCRQALGAGRAALRGQYPVVLVNLGALPDDGPLPWDCDPATAGLFDLFILVRDCRAPEAAGDDVAARLTAAGFRELAIAENFAAGPPPA